MLEIQAFGFVALIRNLVGLRNAAELPDFTKDRGFAFGFLEQTEACTVFLSDMGLIASGRSFSRLIDELERDVGGEAIIQRIDRIQETLHDELEAAILYKLDARFTDLMDTETPAFGEEVFQVFPSAITDVEHAGQCLALGQGTACVFHLMRVMEAALRSLARTLGIPYAPSWESYLKQIETRITAKHDAKDARWKKREPFFRDVAGDLQIVKIVWRNPTMHIVRNYTVDEADEVYRAVRTLVKRVASQIRERPKH
jgi:hypothetical protein